MGADTYKKTTPHQILNLLAGIQTRTIAPYSGGIDSFSFAHGLGYIPPVRIYYQSTDDPTKIFCLPRVYFNDPTISTLSDSYSKFTLGFTIDTTNIVFGATNRDTVSRTIKIFILLYDVRAAASQ